MNDLAGLKQSPLFMLSLSSKELFHSNFLAWLWESYPASMYDIFKEKLSSHPANPYHVNVQRENKNIDLTVSFDEETVLIIENKVKSIPDESQLKDYHDKVIADDKAKIKKFNFILLAMVEPRFNVPDGWVYVSYDVLINGLKNINFKDEYANMLVRDYCFFTETLMNILKYYSEQSTPFISKQQYEQLLDLRIHDIVQKMNYSKLASYVSQHLKDADYLSLLVNESVNSGFSNGTGIIEFKYRIKNNYMLGLQLQGKNLRYVVEVEYDKSRLTEIRQQAKAILNNLCNSNLLWFKYGSDVEPEHFELTRDCGVYKKGYKDICNYTETFYYQYIILNDDCSYERIAKIFSDYCKYISEHHNEFAEAFVTS
ncbi:MAG TPA: hypothetical protein DCX03_05830 [Bacteroidales bacterium]|nr:hypothetical protein [Bacteroidales bacterium]